MRGLKNFKAEQPHQHAVYYTTVLMSEQLWTKDELLDATEGKFNFNPYLAIWKIEMHYSIRKQVIVRTFFSKTCGQN